MNGAFSFLTDLTSSEYELSTMKMGNAYRNLVTTIITSHNKDSVPLL